MNRRFRLSKRTDFERVRRMGQSTAHPLVVLVYLKNDLDQTRIGVSAGRSVGGAVVRSLARRRLREIMRPLIPELAAGYDLILLARKPLPQAGFADLNAAVRKLLQRAKLLNTTRP